MELNGIANIKMALQAHDEGWMSYSQLLNEIESQVNLLELYLKEIGKILNDRQIEVPYWHDIKEKVK